MFIIPPEAYKVPYALLFIVTSVSQGVGMVYIYCNSIYLLIES